MFHISMIYEVLATHLGELLQERFGLDCATKIMFYDAGKADLASLRQTAASGFKELAMTILPMGSSQTAGAGPLTITDYFSVILDRPCTDGFGTRVPLPDITETVIADLHGCTITAAPTNRDRNALKVFFSKSYSIQNDLTLNSNTRRFNIKVMDGHETYVLMFWGNRSSWRTPLLTPDEPVESVTPPPEEIAERTSEQLAFDNQWMNQW